MSYLLVSETTPSGAKKSWLLPESQNAAIYSFGRSRTAHMRSRNLELLDIEIAIEANSNGFWEVTHLDDSATKSVQEGVDFSLDIKKSKLEFKVVKTKNHFATLLEQPSSKVDLSHVLEITQSQGRILKTRLIKKEEATPPSEDMARLGMTMTRISVQPGNADPFLEVQKNFGLKVGAGVVALAVGFLQLIPPASGVAPANPKAVQKLVHQQVIELAPRTHSAPVHESAPAQNAMQSPAGGAMAGLANLKEKLASSLGKSSVRSNSPRNIASVSGVSSRNWGQETSGTGTGSGINLNGLKGLSDGPGGGLGSGHPTGKGLGASGIELPEEGKEITGGLDREVIAQYIKSQIGQILYCYERQLSANPDLYGKVAVRFTIGSSGKVETERIGQSSLRNAAVEGCILQKVARWQFPVPEGGTKVNVTYPFLFKSTN